MTYDVAIVGGGAAGLAAAVTYLRRPDAGRLLILEANDICGRKLLATGNGRCNISNIAADGYYEIKDFFESIGVLCRVEEGGRIYPMSGRAASVQNALVLSAEKLGATIACEQRITDISVAANGGFDLLTQDNSYHAKRVLVATGGKAGSQYGCFGEGFSFARKLGHKVESISPALVPLVYTAEERERLSGLKGVRVKCRAELIVDDRSPASSRGEMLFTDYGLSGVMMFDLSTAMPKSIIEGRPHVSVNIDLVPGTDEKTLISLMEKNPRLWLSGVVDEKLSDHIVAENGHVLSKIAASAKEFKVDLSGTKGWKEAQTTRGGIPLVEIDGDTGESLVVPGLYFAGEVLEPVFLCGGFNLSNAWATGIRAGACM